MNDVSGGLKRDSTRERHPNRRERQPSVVYDSLTLNAGDSRDRMTRLALVITILFWVAQFVSISLRRQLDAPEGANNLLVPRALVCAAGAVLSIAFPLIQNGLRRPSLATRAKYAFVLALVGACVHGLINVAIFTLYVDDYMGSSPWWNGYTVTVIDRLWVFACLSAIALALSYSADIRRREAEISELRELANEAQLRALRSQLNPHFLFNALNSIAALIKASKPGAAELMTEQLADFLRATLELDPQRLISLDHEIELQRLFLEIQQARFPDRLRLRFDIDEAARTVEVPNLITQPLVENAVKYAVARSSAPVLLTIAAMLRGDVLQIVIKDDGGNATEGDAAGAGLGIANVRERLRMHYGPRASLSAEVTSDGGFANILIIPADPA